MILFPNAKINLGLYVTARRPDGYHDIATLFCPTAWRDVLEIVPAGAPRPEGAPQFTLTTKGRPIDCPPEKNLVMRAARAFADAAGCTRPYDIYLEKIIPDGAGLGGGSADAAFTLRGLNELEGNPLTAGQLHALAATIGADCPFFIYNRPMTATGTGTRLTPFDLTLPQGVLAIVKPDESVSTAEAYRGVTPQAPAEDLAATLARDPAEWQGRLLNDFEPTVFAAHPRLALIKERLLKEGALYASMSGSGSSIFGLFASGGKGGDIMSEQELGRRLREAFPGCAIHLEPTGTRPQ